MRNYIAFGLILALQTVTALVDGPKMSVLTFTVWCSFVFGIFNFATVSAYAGLMYRNAQRFVVAGWTDV